MDSAADAASDQEHTRLIGSVALLTALKATGVSALLMAQAPQGGAMCDWVCAISASPPEQGEAEQKERERERSHGDITSRWIMSLSERRYSAVPCL